MSKPYQIESRRAMQRFEASLRENQEPVQLLLPSVEIALAMKQGVGTLLRQAGLQLMQLVMGQKLRELMERPLGDLKLCAVMIDGIAFDGETFVVALGIGQDGRKTVLGLRQGATENATVVGELCADLEQRGVDFQEPRLYVLDGAKALNVAVKKRAGEAALLQRCQLHKRRNVLNHLPDEQQPFMEQKLIAAWNMAGYAEARRALDRIHEELERINPSAARSRPKVWRKRGPFTGCRCRRAYA